MSLRFSEAQGSGESHDPLHHDIYFDDDWQGYMYKDSRPMTWVLRLKNKPDVRYIGLVDAKWGVFSEHASYQHEKQMRTVAQQEEYRGPQGNKC